MPMEVKLKDGRIGWVERICENGLYIVRFCDGVGWFRKEDFWSEENG